MGTLADLGYGLITIVLGIAVSLGVYKLLDFLISLLPARAQKRLRVWAFITPAAALVVLVLLYPLVQTILLSFMNKDSSDWVGFKNYVDLYTSPDFWSVLLNNFLWIAFVPAATVGIGLLTAALGNNVGPRRERVFKSAIFLPMSISFVSAATIWKFMYVFTAPGRPVVGLLNAIAEAFGQKPQPWLDIDQNRLNSFLLMIIIVWLQAGFSMVILSAAIKAVPEETIEAARIDGANTRQVFFRIVMPQIRTAVMSVFVTVVILVMKIFDIVWTMTGGQFNTNVLGVDFYQQYFLNFNTGGAAAVVTILCLLVAPLMWIQIRNVRHQESLR